MYIIYNHIYLIVYMIIYNKYIFVLSFFINYFSCIEIDSKLFLKL